MDVHIWQEVGIICGAITGTGAVLVLGHKYVARPCWDRFHGMRKFFIRVVQAVDELLPNGGGSIRDAVTRIDRSLQKSEARWVALIERDVTATYECAPTGECTYVNRELCNLFGLDKDEMMGNGWLEAIDGQEERERVHSVWAHAVKDNLPYACEYKIKNQLTMVRSLIRTTAEPMVDRNGTIIGYNGTIRTVPEPDE